MGFRCIYCGKDFGYKKNGLETHIQTVHDKEKLSLCPKGEDTVINLLNEAKARYGSNKTKTNGSKKKSVNLDDLENAVEDGRLEMWVNQNGYIVVENVRSGKTVEIFPTKNMDGEKDV